MQIIERPAGLGDVVVAGLGEDVEVAHDRPCIGTHAENVGFASGSSGADVHRGAGKEECLVPVVEREVRILLEQRAQVQRDAAVSERLGPAVVAKEDVWRAARGSRGVHRLGIALAGQILERDSYARVKRREALDQNRPDVGI